MTEEEQSELVAVMWIGRGSFEPEEYKEAVATALAEATTPCADYLDRYAASVGQFGKRSGRAGHLGDR